MSAKLLVVGLDGFDLDVVRDLGSDALPALHGAMGDGAFSHLRSVMPPATLPNWTTFLTGADPGEHGVFDFTVRNGYAVRFAAGTARELPTMFSRLDSLGLRCACLSFPATWPPEELEHGVFMSGWDAPVAFEGDRSFVWPPALYDEIERRFGSPKFDDVDEFHADAPGWIDGLPQALCDRITRKVDLCRWLLAREEWDVFAVYFGESDTAAHYLWSVHDTASPRRPSAVSPRAAGGLTRVYGALDDAVTALREAAGPGHTFAALSDHGSGGSSNKVLYLNRALADAGLLAFKPAPRVASRIKELALRRLTPRLRERLFRLGGAAMPGWLESRVRFGAIDMSRTIAFSDELNYFPAVHLNVAGREPSGIVPARGVHSAALQTERALRAIRDPWSGQPIVRDVLRRDALFEGPFVSRAPDLILDLNLSDGYSYNLMPSAGAARPVWRRLEESELLGKKGRSLPGSHRTRGFFALSGPRVMPIGEIDAAIQDVTATLLEVLGVTVPTVFSGRVLWEALTAIGAAPKPLPPDPKTMRRKVDGETHVERRLRALGYI